MPRKYSVHIVCRPKLYSKIMSEPGTQRRRAVSREGISLHSEKVGPLYHPVVSMLHLRKFQMSPCSQDTDKGDKLR